MRAAAAGGRRADVGDARRGARLLEQSRLFVFVSRDASSFRIRRTAARVRLDVRHQPVQVRPPRAGRCRRRVLRGAGASGSIISSVKRRRPPTASGLFASRFFSFFRRRRNAGGSSPREAARRETRPAAPKNARPGRRARCASHRHDARRSSISSRGGISLEYRSTRSTARPPPYLLDGVAGKRSRSCLCTPSFCLRRAASGGTRSARDAKRPMCRRKTRSGRGTRRAAAVSRRGRRSRGGTSTQSKSASFCSLVSRGSSSLARRAPSGSPSRASPARGRGVGTRRGRAEVEAGVAVGETRLRGAEAVVSAAPPRFPLGVSPRKGTRRAQTAAPARRA